jgi:RsmE family RNA methyltransferase
MNSLIILQTELVDQDKAVLSCARAEYAWATHGLRVGRTVRVAVLGGMKGVGIVLGACADRIELQLSLNTESFLLKPIDLIVGLSRPQTVKKAIQAAVMLGVRSLRFVLSERGQKSYRDSHALTAEHLQSETIKALEQIWDGSVPEVSVHHSVATVLAKGVVADPASSGVCALLAHPTAPAMQTLPTLTGACSSVVVAIGPEAGWSDSEVQDLTSRGFLSVGLGARVLRVEIAMVFMLGQLEVLVPMETGVGNR